MPVPARSDKGYVGIISAELHFPEVGSLKGKRVYLRRIREYVTRKLDASFAEVGYSDLWQRSRVIVAVAASDVQVLEGMLERLTRYLDSEEWVLVSCSSQVVDVDAEY